jgi:pyruvate/2-oxoglutarate dehydrogenase complex dihydrolipoamide dehydrogenase (E3) component
MPEFDLAVIGAGAAGLSVTAVAAQLGLRVALIERDRMGGDCLNTGCVPSKALLAAAHAAQSARAAGRFGIRLPEPGIDWDAVRAHVTGTIAAIAPMDSEARFRALGAEVLRGEARFLDPDTLGIDGRRLTARRIIIATGSRAAIPSIPGLDAVPYLTNETLFTLTLTPAHLLVLGGGPVGLEMAAAHAGLGCRVTLVEAGRIAPREDPELADGLRRAIVAQGVAVIEGASVAAVEKRGELGGDPAVEPGPTLVLADGRRIAGSHLLIAAGRRPNLERLALEAGNVRAGPAGIVTDRGLRSVTNRRVFAIGDIADPLGIGPRAFTHVGSYHAAIVIRRALFRLPARLDYAALPRVIYTTPELAQVGLTEAEARAAGHRVTLLRAPLAENDRAVAERDVTGLVKLVVAGRRMLGAGILAPHAGEMIGQWTLAIARRVPPAALVGLIAPYPTRAEVGKRALTGLFAPRLLAARTKSLVRLLIRLP